jgi:hypothetical protein
MHYFGLYPIYVRDFLFQDGFRDLLFVKILILLAVAITFAPYLFIH